MSRMRMTRSISWPDTKLRPRVLAAVAFASLASGAAACGSGSQEGAVPDPDPEVCSASWQIVFSPRQAVVDLLPSVMKWHDGRLYIARTGIDPAIISLPDSGGAPSTIYDGYAMNFWIEGDRILHVSAGPPAVVNGVNVAPTLLYSTPIAGGPPEVVMETHIWDRFVGQFVDGYALDSRALYWLRGDGDGWGAWRAGRDGSGEVKLASLPGSSTFYDTSVLVPDRLIAYFAGPYSGSSLVSVSRGGGEATPLPVPAGSTVLGVLSDGSALVQTITSGGNGQKRSDHYGTQRLRPSATELEPFWVDKPPPAYAMAAWDDPGRGTLLSVWEWGTDDALHTTIWALDRDGRGTRLACDPVVGSRVRFAAVSPDAIFLLVENIHETRSYWQVARIPR
jgi:hypothetical protein